MQLLHNLKLTEACNFEHVVELADNDHALTVRPARGRSSFLVVIATLGSIYAGAARKLNIILCYQPASVKNNSAERRSRGPPLQLSLHSTKPPHPRRH